MLRRDSGPTGSLFERIREAANPPSYQNPKEALIRSIRRNLRQVLNTRSGSCYGSPELGITDLNDESLASSDFRRKSVSPLASAFYITNLVLPMLLLRLLHRMNTPCGTVFSYCGYGRCQRNQGVFEFDILLDNHQRYCVE